MFASLLLLSVNYYQCIAHDHLIFIISLKLDIYSPLCSSYARLSHIRINPTQFTCLRELLHTWYAGLYMRIPIRMSVRVHSLIFTHEEQSGAHQQLHTHTHYDAADDDDNNDYTTPVDVVAHHFTVASCHIDLAHPGSARGKSTYAESPQASPLFRCTLCP